MRSLSGSVSALKKSGGGKNTHLVFEVFVSVPMCISRTIQENWS